MRANASNKGHLLTKW